MNVLGDLETPVLTVGVRAVDVVLADADAAARADVEATGAALMDAGAVGLSVDAGVSLDAGTTFVSGLSSDDVAPRANHKPTPTRTAAPAPRRILLRGDAAGGGELVGVAANPPRDSLPAPVVLLSLTGAAVTPDVVLAASALGSVRIDAGTMSEREAEDSSAGDLWMLSSRTNDPTVFGEAVMIPLACAARSTASANAAIVG